MAYDTGLAESVRQYLADVSSLRVEEKKMFGGLAFLVNGKMCINVSHDNLMCRFDAGLQQMLSQRKGYLPVIMKGKKLAGYCYVMPEGFSSKKDFEYWMNICLEFNKTIKGNNTKMQLK